MALSREEEGLLEINKQYQDITKTLIGLTTASLFLPIALVKEVLKQGDHDSVKNHLTTSAYSAWALLAISLAAFCLLYLFSAKLAKYLYRGGPKDPEARKWELRRDIASYVAGLTFIPGLAVLVFYFLSHLLKQPSAAPASFGLSLGVSQAYLASSMAAIATSRLTLGYCSKN
jgi:hypothetical protein